MKAMGLEARAVMRVLSPRMLPPEIWLLGSMARTATLLPEFGDEACAQGLNQAALARAGNAGDADADGVAAVGEACFDDALGEFAVSGARAFNEGDGLGEDGAIALQDAFDELLRRKGAPGGRFWRATRAAAPEPACRA